MKSSCCSSDLSTSALERLGGSTVHGLSLLTALAACSCSSLFRVPSSVHVPGWIFVSFRPFIMVLANMILHVNSCSSPFQLPVGPWGDGMTCNQGAPDPHSSLWRGWPWSFRTSEAHEVRVERRNGLLGCGLADPLARVVIALVRLVLTPPPCRSRPLPTGHHLKCRSGANSRCQAGADHGSRGLVMPLDCHPVLVCSAYSDVHALRFCCTQWEALASPTVILVLGGFKLCCCMLCIDETLEGLGISGTRHHGPDADFSLPRPRDCRSGPGGSPLWPDSTHAKALCVDASGWSLTYATNYATWKQEAETSSKHLPGTCQAL